MSHPFTLSQGASPIEQLSAPAAPSSPVPEHSPRSKRHSLPRPSGQHASWQDHIQDTSEGPQAQVARDSPWYKVLKESHSEAFSLGYQSSEGGQEVVL